MRTLAAVLLGFSSIVCCVPIAEHTAASSTCSDTYYPPSLAPSTDRFAVVTAGLSGNGKSTLIDLLGGGQDMCAVGTANGESQTEDACPYHFEFLGGRDPDAKNETWETLDTPGWDDTGGKEHMLANNEVVVAALRQVGEIDAILLVFKYDQKFNDQAFEAFLALRSVFNASIWKRLVIIYTFWPWRECPAYYCPCKTRSDLSQVHQDTIQFAFHNIKRLAGDIRCNESVISNCFPDDIPFIGSDLTLKEFKLMQDIGHDPFFDPSPGSCPITSAGEIRSIRSILGNMTAKPGYQRLNTSTVTNHWNSCVRARSNLQLMINSSVNDGIARDTASKLQECLQGGIATETAMAARLLQNSIDLQIHVAFFMPSLEYVVPPVFSSDTAALVTAYPDYHVYIACMNAIDLNNRDAAVLAHKVKACRVGLASMDGRPWASQFESSVQDLLHSFDKRPFELKMAVALDLMRYCDEYGIESVECSGNTFVKTLVSEQEWQWLLLWNEFLSEGRCCANQGGTWAPRTGVCNGRMQFNQTTIGCLRYCSITAFKIPSCQVQQDGGVLCSLEDARGQRQFVTGTLQLSQQRDGYVPNGGSAALSFDLKDQVSFVMTTLGDQSVTCNEGAWQNLNKLVLPSKRQLRNCTICKESVECLNSTCIPGKGLQNQLWLAGDALDSGLCYDVPICGFQQQATCSMPPVCPTIGDRFYGIGACSRCGLAECCPKVQTVLDGTTKDWCDADTGTSFMEVKGCAVLQAQCTEFKIYAGHTEHISFPHPVDTVHWKCDAMDSVQQSYLHSARRYWTVDLRVEGKGLWQHPSGRIRFENFKPDATTESLLARLLSSQLTCLVASSATIFIAGLAIAAVKVSFRSDSSDTNYEVLVEE